MRGLALVLTAMNLARHSKERQTPTIPNVVVDKKTNHSIPLFILTFFAILIVRHSDKIAFDRFLP